MCVCVCVFVSHDTFLKLLWMSFRTSWVISFVCYILRGRKKPVLLFMCDVHCVHMLLFVCMLVRYIKHVLSMPADLRVSRIHTHSQNSNSFLNSTKRANTHTHTRYKRILTYIHYGAWSFDEREFLFFVWFSRKFFKKLNETKVNIVKWLVFQNGHQKIQCNLF